MAEKKIKGRKRHIGVDTQGHFLYMQVGCANRHDGSVSIELFEALVEKYPSIERFCADGAYGGMAADYSEIFLDRFVDVPRKHEFGFHVIPTRWIVERTFAWMMHSRRLSKDYEILPRHSENMVLIDSLRRTLKRFDS